MPTRPRLQFVAFQKLPKAVPALGRRGDLVTVATNGRILIAAKGGEHYGDWPKGQTVVVHHTQLPRTRKALESNVLIEARVSRKGGILEEVVSVSDQPPKYDPEKVPLLESPTRLYPNWIKVISGYMSRRKWPLAQEPVPINAAHFDDLTNAFKLFTHKRYGHRMEVSLCLGPMDSTIAWGTGYTMDDERAMIVLVMGLRLIARDDKTNRWLPR